MEGYITSTIGLLAVMSGMVGLAFFMQKFSFFSKVGPAIFVIILGIFLSNTGIVPTMAPVYGVIMEYAVYVSIALLLLDVNLKEMFSLSKQPILAIGFAVLSVSIVALFAGLYFAPSINEGWKVAGMFVGTYTGGSANMTAIGMGLDAAPETFALANAADYIVGLPTLIIFFALPQVLKNSKLFAKYWPYRLEDHELLQEDDSDKFMGSKQWSIAEIAMLFGIGFGLVWVATLLSSFFPQQFSSAAKILTLTTLSIGLAQFKPVRSIKGNKDLGLFMAMFFLCVIGFLVDIDGFFTNSMSIAVYCLVVIMGSLFLHVGLCRLFKIKYEYVILSIVAAVADGTTAGILAASTGWESLVSIAIVLGVIGAVLGNYIGIPLAFFLKTLIGA